MNIINVIIICITILICLGVTAYLSYIILRRKYNQKEFELELEKYKFFGSVDTKKIQEEIDGLIEKYFNYYILYNFIAHQKKYIKEDEMLKGVKDITKNIVIEMSELYTFYFKMLYNINNEDNLTAKIYELVNDRMIAYAAEFNRPKEKEEE